MTRNSSHFKKFHQDHADQVSVDTSSSASASAQAELPLRRSARSARVSKRDSRNVNTDIVC